MIALTLFMFYISMYVKDVLPLMTGSAMIKMAATTNSHIEIISRLITLLWGHCGLLHQYRKYGRATIKSRQVVKLGYTVFVLH